MFLWLLAGCFPNHDDYSAVWEAVQDRDRDGDRAEQYGGTDCDDDDPERNGQLVELCGNGIDDNCDEVVDGPEAEDAVVFYLDHDGDGFGLSYVSEASCEGIDGYSVEGGDCNDADPTIHPDADELCDEADVDEDCDGLWDDLDDDAVGGTTWYEDLDGDGYGSDVESTACDLPEDHAGLDGDCDDGDSQVHPEAEEICANGIDDDCDGTYNGCGPMGEVSVSEADGVLYGEADLRAGQVVEPACDVNLDGVDDLLVAAPSSVGSGSHGVVSLFYGPFPSQATLNDADIFIQTTESAANFGWSLAGCFDFEEDGRPDFVVSAPNQDNARGGTGVVYIYNGASTGVTPFDWYSARLLGDQYSGRLGELDRPEDLDGDGQVDLLVGDQEALGPDFVEYGVAWIMGMKPPGTPGGDMYIEDSVVRILGDQWEGKTGATVQMAGDLNSDGFEDVAVAAPYDYGLAEKSGRIHVFLGPVNAWMGVSESDRTILGQTTQGYLSVQVRAGSDIDGDGKDDLLVNAYEDRDSPEVGAGALYVFSGLPGLGEKSLDEAHAKLLGQEPSGMFGNAWSRTDFDSDGWIDLLVGAKGEGSGGLSYLLLGPFIGTLGTNDAVAVFKGTTGQLFGVSVTSAGDQTGDGYPDLVVGAHDDSTVGSSAGAVYLFGGGGG